MSKHLSKSNRKCKIQNEIKPNPAEINRNQAEIKPNPIKILVNESQEPKSNRNQAEIKPNPKKSQANPSQAAPSPSALGGATSRMPKSANLRGTRGGEP